MKLTAVVTGSSSGIGKAIVREFSKADMNVVINYNQSKESALELLEEIKSKGTSVIAIKADVSDPLQASDLINSAVQQFGKVDILVNNAGISEQKLFTDITFQDWRKMFAINVDGMFNCSKVAVKDMLKRHEGKIINISSVGGIVPLPFQACYSATKAGVEIFSRALAGEVKQDNIKVTAVLPGDTKTGFTKARIVDEKQDSNYNGRMKKSVGKMAHDEQHGKSPDTVAKVISKVLKSKRPPLRKTVGFMSKFEVFLTRIVSTKFINFIVKKIYG